MNTTWRVLAAAAAASFLGLGACGGDGDAGDGGDGGGRDGGSSDAAVDGGSADGGGDAAATDGGGADAGGGEGGSCAPLPEPTGATVTVGPDEADALPGIVADAESGTTILLEDGTYRMTSGDEASRRLRFRTPGVTLRSASGDAAAVVIDGEYTTEEMVTISASDVTVAHLTLTHAVNHAIHVSPEADGPDVTGVRLYGLRLVDHGEQFVKVNPNGARTHWVDDGELACSFLRMTDEGRPHVERCCGGCYTGGIDAHAARGWVVRDNRFEDIYCAGEGLAEHAVHFWSASRDTLVERNRIDGCARGIGFGLVESGETRPYGDDPYPEAGYIGHYDGVIRNNFVFADHPYFDTGIELDQARGARVYHNTVFSTEDATGFFSSIDYRFAETDVDIRNNLVVRITQRNGAAGRVESNVEDADPAWLVDAAGGDLHLSAEATPAIDQGVTLGSVDEDIDGDPRPLGDGPDVGADERRP